MARINFETILAQAPKADEIIYSCPCNYSIRNGETVFFEKYNPSYLLYIYTDEIVNGPCKNGASIKNNTSLFQRLARIGLGASNTYYVINLNVIKVDSAIPNRFISPPLKVDNGIYINLSFSLNFKAEYHALREFKEILLSKYINKEFGSANSFFEDIINGIINEQFGEYLSLFFSDAECINSYITAYTICNEILKADSITLLKNKIINAIKNSPFFYDEKQTDKNNDDVIFALNSFNLSLTCNELSDLQQKVNRIAEIIDDGKLKEIIAETQANVEAKKEILRHSSEMKKIEDENEEQSAKQIGELERRTRESKYALEEEQNNFYARLQRELERRTRESKYALEEEQNNFYARLQQQYAQAALDYKLKIINLSVDSVQVIIDQYRESMRQIIDVIKVQIENNPGLSIDLQPLLEQINQTTSNLKNLPTGIRNNLEQVQMQVDTLNPEQDATMLPMTTRKN